MFKSWKRPRPPLKGKAAQLIKRLKLICPLSALLSNPQFLSTGEHVAVSPQKLRGFFGAYDTTGSGKISYEELKVMVRAYKVMIFSTLLSSLRVLG